ncbi:MAG: tRNA 2-thiouridine(34) synthase MnmA [Lachnospiraceae bacterium]|nr:tRNA 2-thiouridine(34) synthase MnmA [Lachnospiraceae bacterium]
MAKIIVGMSGGVDSAVCAYLLKQEGHEVVGVTLRTILSSSECCEIDDVRKAAWKIGMKYYIQNAISDFESQIINPFIDDYLNGVTPNPCVLCNRCIKWEKLFYYKNIMKADYIATGHYASVVQKENGRYSVKQASHINKDQTYMLYRLSQEQIKNTLMPLGKISKDEVRKIAKEAELPVAEKKDSEDICFVPKGQYAEFVLEHAGERFQGEGNFVDEDGVVLGKHKGIIYYTVGQRKGLGLALGYPAYVKEIHTTENEVVIGKEESLYQKEILCHNLNFLSIEGLKKDEAIPAKVKVRYHHSGQEAKVVMLDEKRAKILFEEPVKAASPGQSAVFYDEENCVIGGGIIL